MDGAPAVWYTRYSDEPVGTITAYGTTEHVDGSIVSVESAVGPGDHLYKAEYDTVSGRLLAVYVPACTRHLWYVEDLEPTAVPPAANLIAFGTADFPPGTVIDNDTFEPLALRSDAQVGAIRWWTGTGQVHQIYVAPMERRQRIGWALGCAAAAHLVASGSSSRMWAGGDRTDLGEAVAHTMPFPTRVRPRRRRALPMTPDRDTVGVPRRHLYPDP